MASPQESITTVNGRRCTRSRARTAATSTITSEEPSIITPTEFTTSTAIEQAPQIQTSVAEAPPPPPPSLPPPSSTAPDEQPTTAPTTEAAVTSAIGTIDAVSISSARNVPLANLAPSGPAAAGPGQQAEELSRPVAVPSQVAVVTSASSTNPALATSDTVAIAVPTSVASSVIPPLFTAPAASAAQSSADVSPEQPSQTGLEPAPSPTDALFTEQPQQATSALVSLPSGGSAGIIAPEQGPDGGGGLTLPDMSDANIGSIVGGIIGGVAGFALISGLLFFCLRKRKSRAPRWTEKRDRGPGLMEKLKEKSAGFGVFLAKLKGKKIGPMNNPYQRHTAQNSVSSVYSTHSNGRGRSTSEPQGMFAIQRGGSVRSTTSKKSERNLLRKKPSSVSSNYRFPGVMEDSNSQTNKVDTNPFADPDPPRNLQLLNPDLNSGLVTPQPTALLGRPARDPFASLFDSTEDAQDHLKDSIPILGHKHTQSLASSPPSHLASSRAPPDNNPFTDPSNAPSMPTQAVFSNQKRRSSIAYPAFNATSTAASRDSQFIFFGEPGPSRPGTNMFTPATRPGRTVRQSDPFDLDRPEVLGFGDVSGRKEVRASVTRQPTRSKRTSSVGNWVNVVDGPYGPYERDSVKPAPLWNSNGRR